MKTETATRLIRRSADEIADIVRERICQCSGDEDQILHEGLLAVEFGVSRTPIRQVLQKLAYEHLVETRSGVGTIVSPLDPDARAGQTAALRAHHVLQSLIPADHVAVQCTYFEKSSERNWLVALHQDLSIPVARRVSAISRRRP